MLLWLQRRLQLCEDVPVVDKIVAVAAAPVVVLYELRCGCRAGGGFVNALLWLLIMMLWLQRRALFCETDAVAAATCATLWDRCGGG